MIDVDRILGKLLLESPTAIELLFDLEAALFVGKKQYDVSAVYVCGLARSGSTAVLNALSREGSLCSQTYRDFPFFMAPNLWSKVSRKLKISGRSGMRSHGDGMSISIDSPEAFEEVFWKHFDHSKYIFDDCLRPYDVDSNTIACLKVYHLATELHTKKRYLSKNNNHILRLPSLAEYLPEAKFLVLIRNPIECANSLLHQHNLFSQISESENKYFQWLGHYEFGLNHKRLMFADNSLNMSVGASPKRLEYWLATWVDCYEFLLREIGDKYPNIKWIHYNELAVNDALWVDCCDFLDIEFQRGNFRLGSSSNSIGDEVCSSLKERAIEVYHKVLALAGLP